MCHDNLEIYAFNHPKIDDEELHHFCDLITKINSSDDILFKPNAEFFDDLVDVVFSKCDQDVANLFCRVFFTCFQTQELDSQVFEEIQSGLTKSNYALIDFIEKSSLPMLIHSEESWIKSHQYLLSCFCFDRLTLVNKCETCFKFLVLSSNVIESLNKLSAKKYNEYYYDIIKHLLYLNAFFDNEYSEKDGLEELCTRFQSYSGIVCSTESGRDNVKNLTFDFNGKRFLCEAHTKLKYPESRDNYRIYFKVNFKEMNVYIGHIGKHL